MQQEGWNQRFSDVKQVTHGEQHMVSRMLNPKVIQLHRIWDYHDGYLRLGGSGSMEKVEKLFTVITSSSCYHGTEQSLWIPGLQHLFQNETIFNISTIKEW